MELYTVFLSLLNMSVTAGLIILLILPVRLCLKKAPKVFSYLLWSVALFRLLCPFSFESPASVVPSTTPIPPSAPVRNTFRIETSIPAIDVPVNDYLGGRYYEGVTVPTGTMEQVTTVCGVIWLAGMALLLCWSVISYLRLWKKLRPAEPDPAEKGVCVMPGLETAFVLGVFRPRIYLPAGLSEREKTCILLHEQTHIRRGDHIIRLVSFAALCLHWFNPLVWLAFWLSGRDMEMSCDEAVLKKLGNEVKKEYSTSLLSLASGRRNFPGRNFPAGPLAFGEGDTKNRIKNVLSYRKPAFWVLIAAIAAVAAAIFLLAANPLSKRESMEWLNSLDAAQVRQIELVAMPGGENERYANITDGEEISGIVATLREGSGRYVAEPEALAGGGLSFYLTMQDGSRHHVANNGNVYLVVDGDSFEADYQWLASLDEYASLADSPLPEDFSFETAAAGSAPFGQDYTVAAMPYRALEYSLDISLEDAPRYRLTGEMTLLESADWVLGAQDGGWTGCGTAEPVALTEENFDALFTIPDGDLWEGGLSAQALREGNRSAWQVVREDADNTTLYYILQQNNGELYLTYGYLEGGLQYANIRWVFRLSPVLAEGAEALFALRADYVGSAPAVGAILDALSFPQARGAISLQTEEEPYGLTVEFPAGAADLLPYEKNAVLLLSLIGNLDVVQFSFPSETVSYTRAWAEEWTGLADVRAGSVGDFSSLLSFLNGIVSSESVAQSHPEWEGYAYAGELEVTAGDRSFQLLDTPENPAEEAAANYFAYDIAGDYAALETLCSGNEALVNSARSQAEDAAAGDYIQQYIVYALETMETIPDQALADAGQFGLTSYTIVRADIEMSWSPEAAAKGPQLGDGWYTRLFLCGETDGGWKIYEVYWAESLVGSASTYLLEEEYLQQVLNSVKFTDNGVEIPFPEGMPQEHPLSVSGIARINGGENRGSDLDETVVQPGALSADFVPRQEGDSFSLYLRFYVETGENSLRETAAWYASWVYEGGQMVRQPWLLETEGGPEQHGRELTAHFAEPHGQNYAASMTLPEGWTAAPASGSRTAGTIYLMGPDGSLAATIGCGIVTYYPEAAAAGNFPFSVYSDLMLGSMLNWNNEYTPVRQGEFNADGVPVTETATVQIYRSTGGASGIVTYTPGILSYDLGLLRYISIEIVQEGISEAAVRELAESISLRAE